jgi:hypothetical protein
MPLPDFETDFLDLRANPFARNVLESMPPKAGGSPIWHYTSADGALGIIGGRVLWASSAATLNDTGELFHGLELIERHLDDGRTSDRDQLVDEWVRHARAQLTGSRLVDTYILCASLDGDSQTQFALYGKYAVGLNPEMRMTKVAAPEGVVPMDAAFDMGWRRVLYDSTKKQRHVAKVTEIVGGLAASYLEEENPYASVAAFECLIRAAAFLKHEQFAHEREVRLVGQAEATGATIHFRVREDVIVPYIKVQAEADDPRRDRARLPLTAVHVGHGLNFSLAETGLRVALSENGYKYDQLPVVNVAGTRR